MDKRLLLIFLSLTACLHAQNDDGDVERDMFIAPGALSSLKIEDIAFPSAPPTTPTGIPAKLSFNQFGSGRSKNLSGIALMAVNSMDMNLIEPTSSGVGSKLSSGTTFATVKSFVSTISTENGNCLTSAAAFSATSGINISCPFSGPRYRSVVLWGGNNYFTCTDVPDTMAQVVWTLKGLGTEASPFTFFDITGINQGPIQVTLTLKTWVYNVKGMPGTPLSAIYSASAPLLSGTANALPLLGESTFQSMNATRTVIDDGIWVGLSPYACLTQGMGATATKIPYPWGTAYADLAQSGKYLLTWKYDGKSFTDFKAFDW